MFEKKIAFIGETGAGKTELSLHVLQRERASGGQGNLVHTLPADSPALATMAAVTDEAGISLLSMLQLRESSEIPDEDPSRAVVFDIESAPSALASVSAYLKTHPAARADMRVYYVLNARLSETGTAEQIQASVLGMQEQLEAQVSELKTELFNLRFQLATGQLSNPKKITEVKRDIARAKTVIRLKEQA